MIPFHLTDGHQTFSVAVAVQNGQPFFIIMQDNERMAASCTDQRTGFRPDTPGREIIIGKIVISGTLQFQFFRILSGSPVSGTLPEQGKVNTVGINPAGGAYIQARKW